MISDSAKYPTRYGIPIESPPGSSKADKDALANKYSLRCRQCSDYNNIFHYDGKICSECLIDNCKKCYYEMPDGSETLEDNFTPKASGVLKCRICDEEFVLS